MNYRIKAYDCQIKYLWELITQGDPILSVITISESTDDLFTCDKRFKIKYNYYNTTHAILFLPGDTTVFVI